MVGVGERVIKTRTAAFVGCGVGGARDLKQRQNGPTSPPSCDWPPGLGMGQ